MSDKFLEKQTGRQQTGDGGGDDIQFKVAQLGRKVYNLTVHGATTLKDALNTLGISTLGMEIRINGAPVDLDHIMRAGELVTVVPRIKGGGR